jgi:hypothetical protein
MTEGLTDEQQHAHRQAVKEVMTKTPFIGGSAWCSIATSRMT